MNGLKLHTNGFVEITNIPEGRAVFERLQRALNCDWIDVVHAVNLPEPYCLVIDDEGLLKAKPKINLVVSYLYGFLNHNQPICGDCVIMKDRHTDDGTETVGLDEKDFETLADLFEKSNEELVETHKKLIELAKEVRRARNENS